jgi:hypothetical protein
MKKALLICCLVCGKCVGCWLDDMVYHCENPVAICNSNDCPKRVVLYRPHSSGCCKECSGKFKKSLR